MNSSLFHSTRNIINYHLIGLKSKIIQSISIINVKVNTLTKNINLLTQNIELYIVSEYSS